MTKGSYTKYEQSTFILENATCYSLRSFLFIAIIVLSSLPFFPHSFFSFFLYSSRSRALHLYYSLFLFFLKLSSPLSLSVCLSIFILIYSSCFAISVAPLCSRYSLPISLASSPLFLHTLSFFFHFLPLSLVKSLSVSFTRLIGLLLCFTRAALISLPSVSPSHLHSHDAFSAFLSLFRIQRSLVFLFFRMFTTAVELFSLSYLFLSLIPLSSCAHLSTLSSDIFLLFFLCPTIFFFRMDRRFIPLVLGRFKISQVLNVSKQECFQNRYENISKIIYWIFQNPVY